MGCVGKITKSSCIGGIDDAPKLHGRCEFFTKYLRDINLFNTQR